MNNDLTVALIQSDLVWEDPQRNRDNFKQKILEITQEVDLIVLPEMFTSGFTMNAGDVAETMTGATVSWMKDLAQKTKSAITGSLVISEHSTYFNRLIFMHPDGQINTYDKRHTFTLAGEHKVYQAGKDASIIEYKGWKIKPLICYDLRFPVWARNVEDYDLLLYVANWPNKRVSAWDALLKARAIENMSYCIGVNRIGFDGNHHDYTGHSGAYDVLGERLDNIPENTEATEIVTLSKEHIAFNRNKLGFLNDRETFSLR
ncbi:MAG: amidohydrolase [Psychroserpens sp.]|nr:amidohydrolase [Psychroserpens sp.]